MEELKKRVHEVITMASVKFGLDIPEYKVLVNLSGSRILGQYQVKGPMSNPQHILRFHYKAYSDCKETYDGTIIHEVAHFITFLKYGHNRKIKSHGEEWKYIAIKLGLENPRAINKTKAFDLKQPNRKICYCSCMEHQVSTRMFNIIKKGTKPRVCKHCSTILRINP